MDTSNQYILMCKKAQFDFEINGLINKQVGDCYTDAEGIVSVVGVQLDVKGIWLPRVDQLSEMIIEKELPYTVVLNMKKFMDSCIYVTRFYDTMEQFWLCYVMHEFFNKIWDTSKKDWVEKK